jgi:hypothetical protein
VENIENKEQLDKFINKFIFKSRDFVWYAAHLYGLTELMMTGEKNSKFTYDHEYSTSILTLQKALKP